MRNICRLLLIKDRAYSSGTSKFVKMWSSMDGAEGNKRPPLYHVILDLK